MIPTRDEFCHCPHCGRQTRHSIVRERVLAPVLWCLSCFRTRVEASPAERGPVEKASVLRPVRVSRAPRTYRLAG